MYRRFSLPFFGLLSLGLLFLLNIQHGDQLVTVTHAFNPSGYMDFSFYDPSISGNMKSADLIQTPSGEKPQSKLWYNDGRWWADLFDRTAKNYHIYWLNWATQQWVETGTVLDTRPQTKADCLWDGVHLYVVSGGGHDPSGSGTTLANDGWLFRYSYDPATKAYALDPGFPATNVRAGGAETIVLDKDSTGMLWVTYTQNNQVWVNHSQASDSSWGAPFLVPAPGVNTSVSPDDISSLIAYDGKIGVLWSNQTDSTFYFAEHIDGAPPTSWLGRAAIQQPNIADDHINIKSLQSDSSGDIFAALKTSLNTNTQPQIILLVGKKQTNGSLQWHAVPVSNGATSETRPIVLIDTDHRTLYIVMAIEAGNGTGDVYIKSASLDQPVFDPTSRGSIFIQGTANVPHLNNVTSTKQHLTYISGLVALASYDNEFNPSTAPATTDFYAHNVVDLTDPALGPTVTPAFTATPSATATPIATATPTITPTRTPAPAPSYTKVYLPFVL